MSFFNVRHSIYGRILGISSSGGLVSGVRSSGISPSTDIAMSFQAWGPAMVQTIGAGATLTVVSNCGVTYFTTGSSAAALYTMQPPVKGVYKQLVFSLYSTLVTLNTTSTLIMFYTSTGATGSTLGSSALAVTSSDGVYTAAQFVGLSTTQWMLLSRRSTHVN